MVRSFLVDNDVGSKKGLHLKLVICLLVLDLLLYLVELLLQGDKSGGGRAGELW